jgi:hypothetical protein
MKPQNTTSRNIILGLLILVGLYYVFAICWVSFPLGFRYVGTSAYGACRDAVLHKQSYEMWLHQGTDKQDGVTVWVHFYDGTNYLACSALQIGPFWIVTSASSTILAILCPESYPSCPHVGYHGVSP